MLDFIIEHLSEVIIAAAALVAVIVYFIPGIWSQQASAPQQPASAPPAPAPQLAVQAPTPAQPAQQASADSTRTNDIMSEAREERSQRRQLEDLTPGERAEIGEKYGVKMTGLVGATFMRVVVFLSYIAITYFVSDTIIDVLRAIVGLGDATDQLLLSTALTLLVVGGTYRVWLVNVPKLTGLITTNLINSGELHVFGPGLGIKFPWERYTLDDYIDSRTDIVEKTTTFVTSEGIEVKFDWSMQFTPFLPMLPLYVRTENQAIEDGLEEVVETTFSSSILGLSINQVRNPQVVDLIRENLLRVLEGRPVMDIGKTRMTEVKIKDSIGYPMEERFGITVELGTLSPPTFAEDYKELVLGRVTSAGMLEDAKALSEPDAARGWKGLPPERAFRAIQIINKEPGVTDQGLTIDFTENAKEAAGDIGEALKSVGPALAALAKKSGGNKK